METICLPKITYEISSESSDDSSSESGSVWEIAHDDLPHQDKTADCITISDSDLESESEENKKKNQAIDASQYSGRVVKRLKKRKQKKFAKRDICDFPVKCGWRSCRETFETEDALLFHKENYHHPGMKVTFACHLCRRSLSTKDSLQRHTNALHSHDERYVCPYSICSKVFYHKVTLKKHMRTVHRQIRALTDICTMRPENGDQRKNYNFECSRCRNVFESVNEIMYHYAMAHTTRTKKTFECHLCKKVHKNQQSLIRHMCNKHGCEKQLQCPVRQCSRKFSWKSSMNRHIAQIHGKTPHSHSCNLCNKLFSTKDVLRVHIKNIHMNQLRYKCPMPSCSKEFLSRNNLKEHALAVHCQTTISTRTYSCYICSRICSSKFSLRSHLNYVHIVRKNLKCPVRDCSNKFSQMSFLRAHLAYRHGYGEKHTCHVCGKQLASRQSMENHMSQHGGDRRFKCPKAGCSMSYHQRNQVNRHMASEHGGEPLPFCPICLRTMESKESLESHMNSVHGDRARLKCMVADCVRTFREKCVLEDHMAYVHDIGPKVTCTLCNQTFACRYNIKHHMRRWHYRSMQSENSTTPKFNSTTHFDSNRFRNRI